MDDFIIPKLPWMEQARCKGMDAKLFFPEKGANDLYAKRVCHQCPVEAVCAEYAINAPEIQHGIWGGMAPKERQRERARRLQQRLKEA